MKPALAVIGDESQFDELKSALSGSGIEVAAGRQAVIDAAARPSDFVMVAIMGAAAIQPALAAIRRGVIVALANKECVVAAGKVFHDALRQSGAQVIPVDSEHNAIFQVLGSGDASEVEVVTITASGGPFREWSAERISAATRFLLETRLDPETRVGREVYSKVGLMAGDRFTGTATLNGAQLLKRPEVSVQDLIEWVNHGLAGCGLAPLGGSAAQTATEPGAYAPCLFAREEALRVETGFKYQGYLAQQERQMERMKRAETRRIPEWFDYCQVSGLSREAVEKLTRVKPLTLGQAARIPGITPAAVSLVNVYIEIQSRRREQAATL